MSDVQKANRLFKSFNNTDLSTGLGEITPLQTSESSSRIGKITPLITPGQSNILMYLKTYPFFDLFFSIRH